MAIGLAVTALSAVGGAVAVGRTRSSTAVGLGAGAASIVLGLGGWYSGASLAQNFIIFPPFLNEHVGLFAIGS